MTTSQGWQCERPVMTRDTTGKDVPVIIGITHDQPTDDEPFRPASEMSVRERASAQHDIDRYWP